MVATNVNDMPAFSNADEFLKYCQLVKDSLINQDENGIALLMDEAKVFCESVLMKAKFCRTQDVENCPSFLLLKGGKGAKFVSRLFQSSCYSPWLYSHIRTLHSNIVVEKHSVEEADITFPIPYLERDDWVTVPRLPISLGWESESEITNYYESNDLLKQYKKLPIIDKHFGIAYLYVLSAIDAVFQKQNGSSLSDLLKEKCGVKDINFEAYWEGARNKLKKDLLAKVIGFGAIETENDLLNAFGENVQQVIGRYKSVDLSVVLDGNYSQRSKLFFVLQTKFDSLVDCIGYPPGWSFDEKYKATNLIEKQLNIVFIEEAEKLWGVLCFYSSLLKDSTKDFLDLFWVRDKREEHLRSWLCKKNYNVNSSSSIESLIEKEKNNPENLLQASRFNIPVAALFLAIPPLDSVYRCEVGFVSHFDQGGHSSVKQIWHFADINFPEIVDSKNGWEQCLTGLINKQKVLVGLITEPLLRSYLKEDMEKNIKEKAKQDAELALTKKHGEMLDLLTEPLESLTEALNRTQEDTQRLRAILYNPTKGLFAAAPLVRDYFTQGHDLRLGLVRWNVEHEPGDYDNPFAACAVLAAIVCTVFGKSETFNLARDGNALWCRTLELLNQSDPAFERLTETIKLLLWHHETSNGEEKKKSLVEYMEKVLVGDIIDQPIKDTKDYNCFGFIKESLERFKEVIFTPFKESESKHPLLPLLLIFYDNDVTKSLDIIINDNSEGDNTLPYNRFKETLIKRHEYLAPFTEIGDGLPVPRYSMLLSFLSGVIDYAAREVKGTILQSVSIEVTNGEKSCILMKFSSKVFKDMKNTFEEMKIAIGDRAGKLKGDFMKPFVDFCSLCFGKTKETDVDEFKIQYSGSGDAVYVSSIYAKDDKFKFSVAKEKLTEQANDND
jgi:hypothetical protein